MISSFRHGLALSALSLALTGVAAAEPIRHPTAIFAGLDKTTGRIINFDVAIDETVQFGSLNVTPRVCNTRPQTEAPQTTSFVEVDEIPPKQERLPKERIDTKDPKAEAKRIFSGWMFAGSPGLHGVEHPVYDVWLVDCKGGKENAPPPAAAETPAAAPADAAASADGAAPAPDATKKKKSRKVEPKAPTPVENAPIGPSDSAPAQPAVEAPPAAEQPAAAPGADSAAPAQQPPAGKKKKRKPAAGAAPAGQQPAAEPQGGGGGFFPF
jgi:hypothetical protein